MENIASVYIIYSADVINPDVLVYMDPTADRQASQGGPWPFALTESDDSYDEYDSHEDICHRKWVGELTPEQWESFAGRYCIDLDDDGIPSEGGETLGSMTEYGLIPAVSVDNTEGWGAPDVGTHPVYDSRMYVSIATKAAPND